jgi:Ca2+:H+ antiporter
MKDKIGKFFMFALVFIPISYILTLSSENRVLIFISTVLAIIPLARLIGYATKELVLQTNANWGGLANATLGNSIELIIAVLALSKGLVEIVKASIIGSIIGNILLLIGLSLFFGGLKYKEQKFNKYSIGISSTMLIISITGMAIPTLFFITASPSKFEISILCYAVALVLSIIYCAGLYFSLRTHKHIFDASDEIKSSKDKPSISKRSAIIILFFALLFVVIESEILVSEVEYAAQSIGLTQTFIGVVVVAILTNIAEKASAIHFALDNRIDISLEIGLSSAIQIALFVVPVLVLISGIMGYNFNLVFSLFEIIAVFFAVMIVNYLSADGVCNWLEGAQLITVYIILVIAFYFI